MMIPKDKIGSRKDESSGDGDREDKPEKRGRASSMSTRDCNRYFDSSGRSPYIFTTHTMNKPHTNCKLLHIT
jgi:hypothetical protein